MAWRLLPEPVPTQWTARDGSAGGRSRDPPDDGVVGLSRSVRCACAGASRRVWSLSARRAVIVAIRPTGARRRLLDAAELAAPDLVDVETVSVLRRRWLAGDLTARRFSSAVDDLADLAMTRMPTLPLMRRAYELRANVTAYDASYVALAEHLGWVLLTADNRLATAPGLRCDIEILAA